MVGYYPPERMGGVGEVVAHLHGALLAAGHDSFVLTRGRARGEPRVERIALSPAGFALRLAGSGARARQADLVHCHHGDALLLLLALRLARARTPVLATFHVDHRGMGEAHRPYALGGRRFGTGLSGWLYRTLLARLHRASDAAALRLADAASFISRSTARDVLGPERGGRAKVVYNALPELPDPDPRAGPAAEPVELLYVGTDGPRKRVLALPFVLERVRRALPRARLRLVGVELARSPELLRLFAERGLGEAVVCEGVVPSERVRAFYRAAGVLLVPSAYEGLPMVVLEALQCGLPCVATRVSGHPEVIEDGSSGFLVPPDDPEQMAERCLQLLAAPGLARRLGQAGRARVAERFGLARQLEEYLEIYRQLAGDAASPKGAQRGEAERRETGPGARS